MAKSKFEYVRKFEQFDRCLPNTWIVVRVDGKSFHRFSEKHKFAKPNDERALRLMNHCAESVLSSVDDIVLGYGQSDEYSFVFKRKTETYNRRASKLASTVVSLFTANYVFNWSRYFSATPLLYPPSFDSRVVLYPTTRNLRDYLSWRQVDCHINNLYNTCFWKLVLEGGLDKRQAEARLKVTDSSKKNELLFSEFNTNYNNEPEIYKKGSVLFKQVCADEEETTAAESADDGKMRSESRGKPASKMVTEHIDIIKDQFWVDQPYILGGNSISDGD